MNIKRIFFICIMISCHIFGQNSNSMFYPLRIGDKWEYIILIYEQEDYVDTLRYTKEVIGDSILPNGINYFVTQELGESWNIIRFERFDTLTNEIRYYNGSECHTVDGAVYSLDYSIDSTVTWYQCGTIPHFISYDDSTKTADSACINIEFDYLVFEQSTFQRGLGLTYRLTNEGGMYIRKLIGAKINDKIWGQITDVKTHDKLINDFRLYQNFPNPFNPNTNITYQLNHNAKVMLRIFDINGQLVDILVDDIKSAGSYKINFNAENLSSGVYFYQIEVDNIIETKKCLFLK